MSPITRLSVRSYTRTMRTHAHEYHQLVLPLHGVIEIDTAGHQDRIGPGQCVVIPAGYDHSFRADEQSRFVVVDMSGLPENLASLTVPFIAISEPLQAFTLFVEKQLQHQLNPALEQQMTKLLWELLAAQDFKPRIDPRIARVIEHLEGDLSRTPPLAELADLACLSLTQYKVLFKQQTGKTTGDYLLTLRMEKARALLAHTDYPVGIVAEKVGYQDLSAFSRRFSAYFGQSPRSFVAR